MQKNKRKQVRPVEVIFRGSDPAVNAPLVASSIAPSVAPFSTSKVHSRKRKMSFFPSATMAQPFSFGGRDGRPSDRSCKRAMERPSFEVSDLHGKYLLLHFVLP